MADGSLTFDTKVDTGGFQAGLNQMGKEAGAGLDSAGKAITSRSLLFATSVGSAIGNTISNLAGQAVAAITSFVSDSIETASGLREVQNVVDTTFGESSEKINAWSKNAKNAYGLSELKAKQFTSTMGAMLKSSGIAGDGIVQMSEDVAGLSADMASFYNLDYDTAFEKIRSGISGETEPLKQLGINMSVANLEAFALSKGITKSYDSMTQAEQTTLRYNYLMQVTADAQGDFAKTSDGYANQQRILDTTMQELSATVGELLLPVAQEATKGLLSLAEGAKKAIGWVADLLNPPKSELQQEIDSALEATNKFNNAIQTAGKNLNTSLESVKATKAMADSLLNNYDEILKKNVLTESDTAQLKTIAQEIVALYPDMGTAIDTTTGLFNDNTTAIQKNIDKLADSQKANAYYASMQPYTDALIAGKVAMTTAFKAYDDSYQDMKAKQAKAESLLQLRTNLESSSYDTSALQQYAGQLKALSPVFDKYFVLVNGAYKVTDAYANSTMTAAEVAGDLRTQVSYYCGEAQLANDATATLGTTYEKTQKTFQEGMDQQKAASDAFYATADSIEGYVPPVKDAADANGDLADSGNDATDALAKQKAAIEALKAQIASLTTETLKDIDANVSGFDKMGKVRTQSAKSTLKNLQSQKKYLNDYQKNYKVAQEKGVSDEVLASLRDGSTESAKILAGLASASEKDVASINSTYASIADQKTSLTDTLVTEKDDLQVAFKDAQVANLELSGTIATAATATTTSLKATEADGITSAQHIGTAATAAKTGADSVVTSKDTATQAATDMVEEVPSIVDNAKSDLEGAGTTVDQSVATGVANGAGGIKTAVVNAVQSATGGSSGGNGDPLSGGSSGGGALSAAKTGGYNIGKYIAAGIASGISSNSYLIQNAISQAIQDALAAAKDEAGIKSPSKLFRDEVGRYLAEGVGVGFTGTMGKVNGDMAKSLTAGLDSMRSLRERSVWPTLAANQAVSNETTTIDARQTVIFEQPMQAPDEVARAMKGIRNYGLAVKRT